jgi:phage tail tape-measure protein
VIMRRLSALSTFAGVIMLGGCVQVIGPDPTSTQNVSAAEAVGALAGGALGGYLGAQFGAGSGAIAMTALGVTAGASLGRELGKNFETANRPAAPQYLVLPYGQCLRPSDGSVSAASPPSASGWVIAPC